MSCLKNFSKFIVVRHSQERETLLLGSPLEMWTFLCSSITASPSLLGQTYWGFHTLHISDGYRKLVQINHTDALLSVSQYCNIKQIILQVHFCLILAKFCALHLHYKKKSRIIFTWHVTQNVWITMKFWFNHKKLRKTYIYFYKYAIKITGSVCFVPVFSK